MPRTKPKADKAANNDEQIRNRIVEGARKCFFKHGVSRITIEDIAKASNIARSGVYRYFSTRQEIVDAAIIARLTELLNSFFPVVNSAKTFAEALVKGSLATVDAGRYDPEMKQMLDPQDDLEIVDLVAATSPITHHIVYDFWKPIFDRGRITGEMRADVTDDEAVEWMRGVHLMLILRKELDPKKERNLLEKFLLYSMLSPTALEARIAQNPVRKAKRNL